MKWFTSVFLQLCFQAYGSKPKTKMSAVSSLIASPLNVPCVGGWVTVSWANIDHSRDTDWVGLFPVHGAGEPIAPLAWPIEYKLVAHAKNQSVRFWLIDRRVQYVFYYVSGAAQYPEYKGISNSVSVTCGDAPVRPHLAYAPDGGLYVMWQQARDSGNAMVRWGPVGSKLCGQNGSAPAATRTFRQDDLCDSPLAPAARNGWLDPGYVLWAFIPGSAMCASGTFELVVGDDAIGFTEPLQFVAPLKLGPAQQVKLIAFGDMGTTSWDIDHAFEFSWDFRNEGEIPALNTTRQIQRTSQAEGVDFVLHFGDISYAVGFLPKWEQWLDLIQPVVKGLALPWMASMGNHEYGWSQGDWTPGKILQTNTDSGGECGVPFITHFPFAQQLGPMPPGVPSGRTSRFSGPPAAGVCTGGKCDAWYSFKVGSIHFSMINTEQNLSVGSTQWNWLRADLTAVDRGLTPWLIVTGHRPLEDAIAWAPGVEIAALIKAILSPLFHEFRVDMFWSGHSHNYQRYTPEHAGDYVNLVIGAAGYYNSPVKQDWPGLASWNDDKYGFTQWVFENATHAHGRYVSVQNETLDDFWVQRSFPRAPQTVSFI